MLNKYQSFSVTSHIHHRSFSTSAHLNADPTNKLADHVSYPFKTYRESPILEIDQSTSNLASEFRSNQSGLIERKNNKMEKLVDKSKNYVTELLCDRKSDRSNIDPSDHKAFDKETRKLVKDREDLCSINLQTIYTRDDALDLINPNHAGSDYDSDYVFVKSQNRIDQEYNNLGPFENNLLATHRGFICDVLETLPFTDSDSESSNSDDSQGYECEVSYPGLGVAGPSNYNNPWVDPFVANSNKRSRGDCEESEVNDLVITKKSKLEQPSTESPDKKDSDNMRRLDYVLDKQLSEPYDFTDYLD